jgi:predicted transposase YbfD/YdcC
VTPLSLVAVFADVPDPRSRHGRRYPLVPVLSLVTLGLLLGYKSLAAICEIPANYGGQILLALGFPRMRAPSLTALRDLLAALDANALEAALSRWVASRLPDGAPTVSLDGKTLRGSRCGEVPGQHLVAAYAPHVEAVLAQLKVDAKTNEHKAALELLGILPVKGTIVIGDAAFCQRDLAETITAGGGDYLFTVKANQRGLEVDIGAGFAHETQARALATVFFSPRGNRTRPEADSQHDG